MKQRLLKVWFIFWLIMGTCGIMDYVTGSPYSGHIINTVSIIIAILNLIYFRIRIVK
jgi:hypothetical protein